MTTNRIDLQRFDRDPHRQQVAPVELSPNLAKSFGVGVVPPGEVRRVETPAIDVDVLPELVVERGLVLIEERGIETHRRDQHAEVAKFQGRPTRLGHPLTRRGRRVEEAGVLRSAEGSGPDDLLAIGGDDPESIRDLPEIPEHAVARRDVAAREQFHHAVASSLRHEQLPAPRSKVGGDHRIGIQHHLHQDVGESVLPVHLDQRQSLRPVLRILHPVRHRSRPRPDERRRHVDPGLGRDDLAQPFPPLDRVDLRHLDLQKPLEPFGIDGLHPVVGHLPDVDGVAVGDDHSLEGSTRGIGRRGGLQHPQRGGVAAGGLLRVGEDRDRVLDRSRSASGPGHEQAEHHDGQRRTDGGISIRSPSGSVRIKVTKHSRDHVAQASMPCRNESRHPPPPEGR
ncbi:MAG TPA: hypothetical protein DCG06_00480 [Deltaproteobacteria bacterium]|nr:hypothetical protein [Deltaproteobacteria bacterium]